MNCLKKVSIEKNRGKKIVFTNGCFDILHYGHVCLLKQAKALGDILVVGLNSDESISRLKGKGRPFFTLEARLAVLKSIKYVDYVIIFDEDTPISLIKKIEPDVLVKGGDYEIDDIVGKKEVEDNGGSVQIISLQKGYSTTNIIKGIK